MNEALGYFEPRPWHAPAAEAERSGAGTRAPRTIGEYRADRRDAQIGKDSQIRAARDRRSPEGGDDGEDVWECAARACRGVHRWTAALSGRRRRAAIRSRSGPSLALTGAGASPSKVDRTPRLDIWRDDVNAKGGLFGRPVELVIYRRSEHAGERARHHTKLITVDKVDLLLRGPYGTNYVAQAMPTIIKNKKLTISFTASTSMTKFQYDKYFTMVSVGPEGEIPSPSVSFDVAAAQKPEGSRDHRDPRRRRRVPPGRRAGSSPREIKKKWLKLVGDKSYPPSTTDFAQ